MCYTALVSLKINRQGEAVGRSRIVLASDQFLSHMHTRMFTPSGSKDFGSAVRFQLGFVGAQYGTLSCLGAEYPSPKKVNLFNYGRGKNAKG